MTRIINLYDQRDVLTGRSQARKVYWSRITRQRGGTILAGDFNAHSRSWDSRWKEQCDVTF